MKHGIVYSKRLKGRKYSKKHREAISNSLKNKLKSDEHKKKLSLVQIWENMYQLKLN